MPLPISGESYWLPPEVGSHDKDSPRPHVVVSPAPQNDAVVTLAFGSTSDLQAVRYSAPHVIVDSSSATFPLSGLSETTFFYPSRLAVSLLTDMPRRPSGRIVDEFPELRDRQLPRAVGLGTGVVGIPGPALSSRRGQIAVFTSEFTDLIGAAYGVVVTWPPYSLRDQVQNVVPIVDGAEFDAVAPNILISNVSWVGQLDSISSALLMVQLVQGAYDGGPDLPLEERDIRGYLPEPIDPETMRSLDEALAYRLLGVRLQDALGAAAQSDS